jgi:RNA polymerase sigma-70 factor, ECF subfamily
MNPDFERHTAHRNTPPMNSPVHQALAAVWRLEAPKVTARVARIVGDLASAEELTQDTFLAALERWERDGIPDKPGAWLATTARFLAIDLIRRRDLRRTKYQTIAAGTPQVVEPADAGDGKNALGDDLLGLIFMACHPILSPDARSALTLKHLCGLNNAEIARAFLTTEPTIAQRIVRAKRSLAAANVRFELPEATERAARIASVLEVIYLVFNEGYTATTGDEWLRASLCQEAMRLGRMIVAVAPDNTEALGLLVLMELQASRLRARVTAKGEPILLLDQDRTRWDRLLIQRGFAGLDRLTALGGSTGPYALQAAIAACHARALRPDDTDWARIAAIYDALAQVTPSPVVELNRAVAVGMAFGPAEGLAVAEPLRQHPATKDHHLLAAVVADLLCKNGQHDEARHEFLRAAALTHNTRERTVMLTRATDCATHAVR